MQIIEEFNCTIPFILKHIRNDFTFDAKQILEFEYEYEYDDSTRVTINGWP